MAEAGLGAARLRGLDVCRVPIGWTVSHLVLAVIYFLILTPIGLVVRWFRPDPLGLKLDRERKTYWVPHDPGHDPKRYFRQF